MKNYVALVTLLTIGTVLLVGWKIKSASLSKTKNDYWRSDNSARSTTADILKQNGYLAENYYVTTGDGYRLNLVRAQNPLIDYHSKENLKKQPILMMHGRQSCSEIYVIRLADAKPRDLSKLDLKNIDEAAKLNAALDPKSPNSQSFVSLLLDLGHEVWLLDERSAPSTQALANLEYDDDTMDYVFVDTNGVRKSYFNYTLDDEAKYDVPEVINYVLYVTQRPKLSFVGWSISGAIILMSLSSQPHLADKIESASIWGPVFTLGHNDKTNRITAANDAFLMMRYNGPVPPLVYRRQLKSIAVEACQDEEQCLKYLETRGVSGDNIAMDLRYLDCFNLPDSSKLYAQRLQSAVKGSMHYYDYYDEEQNYRAYGQSSPPKYDLSKVRLDKMTFWRGNTDSVVTEENLMATLKNLSVPAQFKTVGDDKRKFNHLAHTFHKDVGTLFFFPALKDLLG